MTDANRLVRLEAIMARATEAIIAFDDDLRVMEWNEAAARIFGVAPEDALGQPVAGFFALDEEEGPEKWAEMTRNTGTLEIASQARRQGTGTVPVAMLATRLPGQHPSGGVVLYVRRPGPAAQELEILRQTDEFQQKADLLNALIDGELNSKEVAIERGRSLGMDLSARYALFAISIDDYRGKTFSELQKDQRGMKEALRQVTHICSAEQDKIVWTRYDGFAVLCPLPQNCADIKGHAMSRAKAGKERVTSQLTDVRLTVGVSSSYADVTDISKCYREAREAVNVGQRIWGGNGVYHYADLGICQLLTQFKDRGQLQAFVDRSLGKLIRQDAEKGTQLVATLEEILATANLKEAAERCFVHHKTILARKNKIETILGVAIDDVEARLTLSTAMKILRLLSR